MIRFVTLTQEQRDSHNRKVDAWTLTLVRQAQDNSDSETRDNARLLLTNRGIRY